MVLCVFYAFFQGSILKVSQKVQRVFIGQCSMLKKSYWRIDLLMPRSLIASSIRVRIIRTLLLGKKSI